MNHSALIAKKIAQLSDSEAEQFSDEELSIIATDKALRAELDFIASFWHTPAQPLPEPSSQLDSRFYEMLAQANSVQNEASPNNNRVEQSIETTWTKLKHFASAIVANSFSPQVAGIQLAVIAGVFTLGYSLNSPPSGSAELFALQQQVDGLHNRIALSLIQKGSASERLSGVSYGKQHWGKDAELTNAMLQLLNHDPSSNVRLAVVATLDSPELVASLKTDLISSVVNQHQPIVQLALIKQLLRFGPQQLEEELMSLTVEDGITEEVKLFLNKQLNKNLI
ncbi:hypothetical protein ACSLBF_20970 (plasmid) [Pseudoalteromonas sp. T1lg65]|uniref:hypothetical protein n=1 Tax=Pseudoalteromonas sp. T1lg65 TaxID=2077101 RepID=UPI003F79530A